MVKNIAIEYAANTISITSDKPIDISNTKMYIERKYETGSYTKHNISNYSNGDKTVEFFIDLTGTGTDADSKLTQSTLLRAGDDTWYPKKSHHIYRVVDTLNNIVHRVGDCSISRVAGL